MSFFTAGGMVSWAEACIKKNRITLSIILLMTEDCVSGFADFIIQYIRDFLIVFISEFFSADAKHYTFSILC